MEIREAIPDDCDVIARFNVALAVESEGLAVDPMVVQRGVEAMLGDRSKGIYHVAVVDGAVVGQVMITYEWSDWRNGTIWWLQSVYVQKEFRRQGIFKMLFAHVLEKARLQRDVCTVRLYMDAHNATARKSYEGLGMQQTNYVVFETEIEEPKNAPALPANPTPYC